MTELLLHLPSLNPYSIGRYSLSNTEVKVESGIVSLNPYSIGRYSLSGTCTSAVAVSVRVLILILLEDTL